MRILRKSCQGSTLEAGGWHAHDTPVPGDDSSLREVSRWDHAGSGEEGSDVTRTTGRARGGSCYCIRSRSLSRKLRASYSATRGLCRCEYDYLPDESSLFGEWYVYHFMQGGHGIRALR